MNAFWIFAIILTIGYIIYYAVIIMQEMYGKKDEVKTDEEDFDVPVNDESPTAIQEENPIRFDEYDNHSDIIDKENLASNSNDADTENAASIEEKLSPEPEVIIYDPEHPSGISSKEKLRRAQLGFEEVDINSTGEETEVSFKEMLKTCTPSHPTVKIKYDRI